MAREVSLWFYVVALALALGSPLTAYADVPTEDRGTLDDAAQYRAQLGFASDPGTVMRAAEDRDAYPDMTWGIPMSLSEAAEMQRRIQLQIAVHPAVERFSDDPDWAGWWVDQLNGGTPILQFAGNIETNRELVGSLVDGDDFRVVEVEHSLAQLGSRRDEIVEVADELERQGANVTGVGLDTPGNRVRVSLSPDTELAREVIRAHFPEPMVFVESATAQADAYLGCLSGCLPMKAGIGIIEQSGTFDCTTGYLARRTDTAPDQLIVITAGHCIELAIGTTPWEHGGITTGTNLVIGGDHVEAWFGAAGNPMSSGDVGATTVASGQVPTTKNYIVTDASPLLLRQIEQKWQWQAQTVGTNVCRMGRHTGGPKCGLISDNDETKKSEANGITKWIQHTVVYGRDADLGDSGGPMYVPLGSGVDEYAVLFGTHVHSQDGYVTSGGKGWYTPWDRGQTQLQASFSPLTYTICITPTCGF